MPYAPARMVVAPGTETMSPGAFLGALRAGVGHRLVGTRPVAPVVTP